uniref:Uncharacterized protein n=1 Tax=Picea glauca TaxID=3330 RepID=A0A124GN65_PICGL|nr:hypothetical protein ABT39_MTgene4837 [Picea glauca]QHR88776.1 hypothetical protein Q903MT_gene2791 [Picea sitchensis]
MDNHYTFFCHVPDLYAPEPCTLYLNVPSLYSHQTQYNLYPDLSPYPTPKSIPHKVTSGAWIRGLP